MIFDPSTSSYLKPWLVRTLEPICDAEPGALADYILALLKHNVPENEMRKELAAQLDEFLEKEGPPFIDTLFTVLRTKSYLPYAASPTTPSYSSELQNVDTGIPIPLDGLISPSISSPPDRTRKRGLDSDDRDGRPPAKGPRLSAEGQFSRYSSGRDGPEGRSTGGWAGTDDRQVNGYGDGSGRTYGDMNGSMGYQNGRRPQQYRPPDQKRGICRDYHNNGYCARGALCKYSHGDDAVVPGPFFPSMPGPMPFMPMFNPGLPFDMAAGGAYDPHQARMDMRPVNGTSRPHQRAPLLPRIQQEDGSRVVHPVDASGELPVIQDLTPSLPPHQMASQHPDEPHTSQPPSSQSQSSRSVPPEDQMRVENETYLAQGMDYSGQNMMTGAMDVDYQTPMRSQGNLRGRPRPGGRGTFSGEVHSFRPERRNDKTLVVEKIPTDKLSLEQVNSWFKRFGTVTNVAIDVSSAKALVSFSNHEEAHAAWKSEDAVFGNRFVKVFWHRPMEGHGQLGARMLAASAPVVATMSKEPAATSAVTSPLTGPVTIPSTVRKSSTASALATKQQQLEQQIAEQKSLMASLETATPEEKKSIMARLRKLGEEMSAKTAITSSPASSSSKPVPTSRVDDHERKEKERLDKELDMHAATAAVEGGGETTEDLKAKLEALKAEAASLGLTDNGYQPSYHGGGYRPYRGRGRGPRGHFYRGAMRGGPPRASMKLDNRPKKLLVKGVKSDGVQTVREWYESTGQLESMDVTDDGDIIVAFNTRAAAELGFAKGHNIPALGSVQISWYTPNTSTSRTTTSADNPKDEGRPGSPDPSMTDSPQLHEEEAAASGWGGDGDGEDGMGML